MSQMAFLTAAFFRVLCCIVNTYQNTTLALSYGRQKPDKLKACLLVPRPAPPSKVMRGHQATKASNNLPQIKTMEGFAVDSPGN